MEKQKIRIKQYSGLGLLWFAGWLFSIGYLELSFWKGVAAIIVWPYFFGAEFAVLQDAAVQPPPAN